MATIKEQVKESLLGTDEEPQLSAQTRHEFMQHAIKDEASGEYFMGEKEFVDAVAPENEDYVGIQTALIQYSAETRLPVLMRLAIHSTRSSAASMQSCSTLRTTGGLAALRLPTGAPSTTSSRSPMPNTRLRFASSQIPQAAW